MIVLMGAFCTTHDESRPLQHNDASRQDLAEAPGTRETVASNSNPIGTIRLHFIPFSDCRTPKWFCFVGGGTTRENLAGGRNPETLLCIPNSGILTRLSVCFTTFLLTLRALRAL